MEAFAVRKISEHLGVIDKPSVWKIPPNMSNYEETYAKFTWEDARKEIDWFEKDKLNAAYNVVDRHAQSWRKNKVALYWEGATGEKEKYTFLNLKNLSNQFANLLRNNDVQKGDRIFIFLPRIPELFVAFLGILKVGAIATTIFSAFGPEALKDRLLDAEARMIVTTPELKGRVEEIWNEVPSLTKLICIDNRSAPTTLAPHEISYSTEIKRSSPQFKIEQMNPDDYAFMLYTSGTTGKAKGIIHVHGGIIQQHISAKWVLDLKDEDIYWCTADPGWVTGVSYGILGSWSNGISSLVYDGRFDAYQWYRLIDEYEVTLWYTAPTAIRMLMREGDEVAKKFSFKSLRQIISVGEPLNPEAIRWGLKAFGLPIHDTWWQTETGSILISNYPVLPIKLGSMGKPSPGVVAGIVDDEGRELPQGTPGNLAIKPGWPSMFRGVWRNELKYKEYFKKDWYISGDKAYEDEEGYFWFIGRADDVIMTAGERVGPFEVESALVEHPAIAEAGVIGKPEPLRGEIIKAFVTLREGYRPTTELTDEIKIFVKKRLAGQAYPREVEFVDSLPKTRSGKIMRRVLKARELGLPVGDTTALEE